MKKDCSPDYFIRLARLLRIVAAISALLLSLFCVSHSQTPQRIRWRECLSQPPTWYSGNEAIRIADNLLLYQFPSGGWPKNIDMAQELDQLQKNSLRRINDLDSSTIDNGATYTQLRYLAKVYTSIDVQRFKEAFIKGFDYLLNAQYPNGGWPQFYPLREGYYSHITFNDDAMIGAMSLLRDVYEKTSEYPSIDRQRREKARIAVAKGVVCILKCQIKVHGVLTAWCAQHDEGDLSPAKARTYEL